MLEKYEDGFFLLSYFPLDPDGNRRLDKVDLCFHITDIFYVMFVPSPIPKSLCEQMPMRQNL